MANSFRITFEPAGIAVEAEQGTDLLSAAANRNIPIRSDCGGKGLCGKCRVMVEPADNLSPPAETELAVLTADQVASGYRLACQATLRGPVRVIIPAQMADSREARGKSGITGRYGVEPSLSRILLPEAAFSVREQGVAQSISGWLAERARAVTRQETLFQNPHAIRQLSRIPDPTGELTLVDHADSGITAVISGRRPAGFGVAVDIGTTTLAAYLCDLTTGEVLTAEAAVNPQRRYGEDVISRIAFADENPAGLETMNRLVVEAVDGLIGECLKKSGYDREDVDEIAVVGNTTMEQIFGGFHPHGLGVTPYMPAARRFPALCAADLGLKLNPGAPVHLFPVISGFVGGDTLGAILADALYERAEITLIVDIGTNGEVVLGNRDQIWATSCATGPALEGAQIACGMRAVSGAIHKVHENPKGEAFRYEVLGQNGTPPVGICGSGIIDAMAVLRRNGVIRPNGRLNESHPGVVSDEKGIGRKFILAPAAETGSGSDIAVTLQDVRQIQLAKSALALGIRFLMRQAGVASVERTILTGAFGARFDWRKAVDIGMLPQEVASGQVLPMDNLAGVGAVQALLNRTRRAEAGTVSRQVRFIELAEAPDFAVKFAEWTAFPPLDDP